VVRKAALQPAGRIVVHSNSVVSTAPDTSVVLIVNISWTHTRRSINMVIYLECAKLIPRSSHKPDQTTFLSTFSMLQTSYIV
jgi:hypothetical protein